MTIPPVVFFDSDVKPYLRKCPAFSLPYAPATSVPLKTEEHPVNHFRQN